MDGGAPSSSYPFGAAEPAAEVIEMGEGGRLLLPVSSSKPHDGKVRGRPNRMEWNGWNLGSQSERWSVPDSTFILLSTHSRGARRLTAGARRA